MRTKEPNNAEISADSFEKLEKSTELEKNYERLTPERSLLKAAIVSMRPHQWIKNVFVLAPVFFSMQFLEVLPLFKSLAAALLFSFGASAVYLFNDIFDIEKDQNHPTKKHRPIPSGQLPKKTALFMCWVLAIGAVFGATLLDWRFGAALGFYLVMNLAYSTVLKHVPFVDVSIIATGFVLRVLGGAFAINVLISEWLFVCTFLLALYLGLGKRQHELRLLLGGDVTKVRKVLERYHPEILEFTVLFVAGLTIAVYTIYTLSASLPNQPLRVHATPFNSQYLPVTIPFTVFGITRFYQLINKNSPESPTELLVKDKPFILNLVGWGICALILVFIR